MQILLVRLYHQKKNKHLDMVNALRTHRNIYMCPRETTGCRVRFGNMKNHTLVKMFPNSSCHMNKC